MQLFYKRMPVDAKKKKKKKKKRNGMPDKDAK